MFLGRTASKEIRRLAARGGIIRGTLVGFENGDEVLVDVVGGVHEAPERSVEELRDVWKRLNKPQRIEDYGLSITLSEMKRLPEAREMLAALPSQGVHTLAEEKVVAVEKEEHAVMCDADKIRNEAWAERALLVDKANKLYSKAAKLRDKANKCCERGDRFLYEGNKLWAKADGRGDN